MIKTKLTREDALKLLEIGQKFHAETRFHNEEFNKERVWALFQKIDAYPSHFFIAYDDEFRGVIMMARSENYWSGEVTAQDMCFFVTPEARGTTIAVRLEKAAREWAKEIGATEMVIYHNTGIDTDNAPDLFNRLGYARQGYIFSREI